MVRFLALALSLCLFSSAAAETCKSADATTDKGNCAGVTMPTKVCDGADGGAAATYVKKYIGDLEEALVADCESFMKTNCPNVKAGATGKTGADVCGAFCVGPIYCDVDADCPTEPTFPENTEPLCCDHCEKSILAGCDGVTADEAAAACKLEPLSCKTTNCMKGTSLPTAAAAKTGGAAASVAPGAADASLASAATSSRPTLLFLATAVVALFAARQ